MKLFVPLIFFFSFSLERKYYTGKIKDDPFSAKRFELIAVLFLAVTVSRFMDFNNKEYGLPL